MAWLGKVSLGGFPDLAGAVTKLSESVKNIEKNFDSALGLEEKSEAKAEASGAWGAASERKGLFDLGAFMGHIGDGSAPEASVKAESLVKEESLVRAETSVKDESSEYPSSTEGHDSITNEQSHTSAAETIAPVEKEKEDSESKDENIDPHKVDISSNTPGELDEDRADAKSDHSQAENNLSTARNIDVADSVLALQKKADAEVGTINELQEGDSKLTSSDGLEHIESNVPSARNELHHMRDSQVYQDEHEIEAEKLVHKGSPDHADVLSNGQMSHETEVSSVIPVGMPMHETADERSEDPIPNSISFERDPAVTTESISHDTDISNESAEMGLQGKDLEADEKKQSSSTTVNIPVSTDSLVEVEKVKKEMKMMEAALQGAARQAQAKADEIAKLMNENEQLKSTIEDLKRKSTEAEIDALREEYHQRVASLERKVYALTRERDTLRREQSKKSDAAALLKEKDEIICQVMAEGEELSKKQAAQEATIRKLRAQIREFEEEKQRLNSKLQVEESKVESIKRDKAATEKLLQETIERNQVELAAQKEFYTNALNAAKEAEALAESRANNEAKIELESRLREASEREAMLVQTLEELRQTLSRTEQQAAFREEMLRRDIDDLQKRYQASELRYNELITQVPESTRPLLRQIEAMQETTARRAEAWAGVERALNSRLQEAEAKAAAAEERERALNERLSQSLSRMTVLETQITCLRTEQTQLSRSLEKERQRASESRQEYLAAMEEAATQEGRAKQLEDEIKELRSKHKKELQEAVTHRELLEKELERERNARLELEKSSSCELPAVANQDPSNVPNRKLSSAKSLSSMEESLFLQASLDSSDNFLSERRISGETSMSPYFLKSMTPSAFEAALRQKDGEISSYMSRLASLESIRDSLAEELVKMTEQCEKLRTEAAFLPGLRTELEALRRRHSSALELMGERDEELEELRADIVDLKEMYREQVDLLVNRIQMFSSSTGAA
ncbi:golgin candidate 5 isoform X2 [Elaeis guineensis]|uniref:Golgin candidate 5 isoform X2 n=1 Tax=Elaeis guineensis var. tenera TaxID=51953 RepID=A0A8N4EX79_ELAGV|nr:golgin candidate 5 isoform X2 [Elaeis guineensis]